jgi:hypothetical protein
MSETSSPSIFARYYQAEPFVDRLATDREQAVDVVIPIIHANEFWHANLVSIYREVPVKRLILGDGGCIDGSMDIARKFPRVEVLDHRGYTSLGYSIRHLIEAVRTEWFIYLHSDVYLPPGWFDTMCKHRLEYDWFECNQHITVLAEYPLDLPNVERPFSGSQMGRKAAFQGVTPVLDDDYLYRNEDIILAGLVKRTGFRYGKTSDTFHFHQVMVKPGRWRRNIKRVDIHLDLSLEEEVRANETFARGIIKYLSPSEITPEVFGAVRDAIRRLVELKVATYNELREWTQKTNPIWVPHLDRTISVARRERLANHIIAMAEIYRDHGFWMVTKRVARKIAHPAHNLLLTSRGGLKRLAQICREQGVISAWRHLLRRGYPQ